MASWEDMGHLAPHDDFGGVILERNARLKASRRVEFTRRSHARANKPIKSPDLCARTVRTKLSLAKSEILTIPKYLRRSQLRKSRAWGPKAVHDGRQQRTSYQKHISTRHRVLHLLRKIHSFFSQTPSSSYSRRRSESFGREQLNPLSLTPPTLTTHNR
jgi:hypothetical protein